MSKDQITNDYFEWMYDLVCKDKFNSAISYRKLLMCLHSIEFTYLIPNDQNRAEDGVDLRYRYAQLVGDPYLHNYISGPCSVLEMLIALSIRCEESIMDDPRKGDRTEQWFWEMLSNLGLSNMDDSNFNRRKVYRLTQRFLDREYEPDGSGGLFTIKGRKRDMRDVEIWYQLNWYLDQIEF